VKRPYGAGNLLLSYSIEAGKIYDKFISKVDILINHPSKG